jgi:hypothetical protein
VKDSEALQSDIFLKLSSKFTKLFLERELSDEKFGTIQESFDFTEGIGT